MDDDDLLDMLYSEPPLADQVLALGKYLLQLTQIVDQLAAKVAELNDALVKDEA